MKMNKLALACGAALLGASAVAQADISANIGATSDYVWRGVTQTGGGAAISGGIDYAHESGFYLGTWASDTNFGSPEWDIYGGFAGEASGIGYDIGVFHYMYPDIANADFTEIGASASYSMFTIGANYTVQSEVTKAPGNAFLEGDLYYYASASFDLPENFGIGGTIGHYSFDQDAGVLDYTHGQVDVTKSAGDFGDFTFSLSKAGKSAVLNGNDTDVRVFVSWAKTF
jgi:uncharacterized protein (TIGR02001 family)